MSFLPLEYVSENIFVASKERIPENLNRYRSEGFYDLSRGNGWRIKLKSVTVDSEKIAKLNQSKADSKTEVEDSLLVYSAISGMTPAIARDERIWFHLAHLDCIDFARKRWLKGVVDEKEIKSISKHFCSTGLTQVRDDSAIGRLWWNGFIAEQCWPERQELALNLILKSADIRSNFVERTGTTSRPVVSRALLDTMHENDWLTSSEASFRTFMKVLNRDGGGILFEKTSKGAIQDFFLRCIEEAKEETKSTSGAL